MLDLGIVILNWNTRDLLRRCLETVFASVDQFSDPARGAFTYQVVVVDNASTDSSAEMVAKEFPQATLIVNPANNGFSYGNNIGLRTLGFQDNGRAQSHAPRYAVLLNPDTEVPPNAFVQMVEFMDAEPSVGAAGPKLVLPDGSLDKACRRSFPTPKVSIYHFLGLGKLFPNSPRFARYNMTFLDPDQEAEVDSVVGAFMMVRREAVERAGLLDETFFMYGEDIDWAYRIQKSGWKIVYHPQVTVKHVKRAASRQSKKAKFEFSRAMLIFYRKHYRATTPLWLHSLIMTGLLLKGGRGLLPEIRQSALP